MDADKILKRFEALETARAEWDGIWQQCSDYVLPRSGQSNRRAHQIFDSTAPLALGRFAAALESLLTPRDRKWHGLSAGLGDLDRDPEVSAWLEALRDLMFAARHSPESNFANQLLEAYLSLGLHGTAVVFIDDDLGRGLRYQCIPVPEVYLAEDGAGRVDTVFRWYRLSARQALREFGDELPEDIRRDAEDPARLEKEHEFIHGVFPRREARPGRGGASLPVASVHLARGSRKIVRESGYRCMPYAVSRFMVTPGEVYGRSPAMEVMPDIVQVNAMKKTILRAAEKMVNPPLLTPDDDVLAAFSLKAGAINYGGLDEQGRQRVVPLELGGKLPIGLELIEQGRRAINEGFYLNLFQLLAESPQKTATEVMELAWEKAQLLAPSIGRQQSELLGVIIERELDILIQGGLTAALPPMPPSLAEAWARGLRPKYESDISRAMAGREGQVMLRALSAIGSLAQFDPSVTALIDAEAAARQLWSALGGPAAVTRKAAEISEIKANQQMAAGLESLPGLINGLGKILGKPKPEDLEALASLVELGLKAAIGRGRAGGGGLGAEGGEG